MLADAGPETRKYGLRNNLSQILDRLLGSLKLDISEPEFDRSQQRVLETIRNQQKLSELPTAPPTQSGSSIESNPISDQARELDILYLDWLRTEQIKNELKYTELAGRTQHRAELRNLFRRLPGDETGIGDRFALAARKDQLEPFEDAVDEILTLRRAVLLGDSGSVKSLLVAESTRFATRVNPPC